MCVCRALGAIWGIFSPLLIDVSLGRPVVFNMFDLDGDLFISRKEMKKMAAAFVFGTIMPPRRPSSFRPVARCPTNPPLQGTCRTAGRWRLRWRRNPCARCRRR